MSDYQLTNEDHEALEKFTKFFLVKSAQTIVQSRLGEKTCTKSKPVCSGNEWFHLSIKDIPEVTVNTKQCLKGNEYLLINHPHHSFSIEISLQTPENEIIPLETWCISFDDSVSDPTQRVRYNIYNRMSIVLRSLLTCTRATPAYQLSRQQSPDKYIICYKMSTGEPIISQLGEHYSKKTIGHILTPIGQFILNVAYRTCITISSIPVGQLSVSSLNQCGIEIKDDYFALEKLNEDFDAQLPSIHNVNVPKSSPVEVIKRRHPSCDSISSSHGTPEKIYYSKLRTAFATPGFVPHYSHLNFSSRMHDNDGSLPMTMPQQQNSLDQEQQSKHNLYISNELDNENAPDDFILVEVKPFFGRSDSTDDLALFIRSCQQPPKLDSFTIEPSLSETINQLNDELRVYESKVEEFDQLVTNFDKQEKIDISN